MLGQDPDCPADFSTDRVTASPPSKKKTPMERGFLRWAILGSNQ
jgi:hypothetical protein